jgi:hypothetical protein
MSEARMLKPSFVSNIAVCATIHAYTRVDAITQRDFDLSYHMTADSFGASKAAGILGIIPKVIQGMSFSREYAMHVMFRVTARD